MIDVWKYPIECVKELKPGIIWQPHSEFTNGVNLVNEDGELLFIGTDKNGELPFGIHLTFRDLTYFKSELSKTSRFCYQDLIFYHQENPSSSLSLKKNTPYSVSLQKFDRLNPEAVSYVVELASKIEPNKNGLGESLPTSKFLFDCWSIEQKQAVDLLLSDTTTEIQQGLRYFIGRGQGLTPSGDDFLVGLLSIEKGFSILDNQFENTIDSLISTEKLTTDISEAYLQAALKGRFSTSMNQLIEALAGKRNREGLASILTKIIKNGHTSGIDTLSGILVGLLIGTNQIKKG